MIRFFLLLFFYAPLTCIRAQEMLGIVNSNFAGNVGFTLNPASVVGMPFSREFNLIALDISAHNNYLYYPAGQHGLRRFIGGEGLTHDEGRDYYTTTPDKQLYANIFLLGPSYARSNDSYGWAFHTAVRANASVQHLNYHLAKFIWDGFDFFPQQKILYRTAPFQSAFLQWYELGFTYGKTLSKSKAQMLTAGATFNIDLGANAAYINNTGMDYMVPSSDTLIVTSISATYGHTITSNHPAGIDYLSIKGIGAGISLGVQYYQDRDEKAYFYKIKNRKKYSYKIGASLIDLGLIHFGSNASTLKFENASAFWPGIDTVKFNGLNDFDQLLNYHFTGRINGATDKNNFNMFLPAAASLQFDYNIQKAFYANFTWVQRLGIFTPMIKRANEISISVRYETPNFEAAIPFSFYEYYKSRFGIAFRFKWFFIGTDKFGPVLDKWDVDGLDFYFGIRFNNHKKTTNRAGSKNDCPAY